MKISDILILGGGCAGTSLAHYLEDFGYGGKVSLLDSRTNFDREQRWCSWTNSTAPSADFPQKSWQTWTVGGENRSITGTSAEFCYRQIYAPDFFRFHHSRWQNADAPVEISLGERIERVEKRQNYVEVTTNHGIRRAQMVFDGRHRGSENFKNAEKTKRVYLQQTFFGWKIEFPRAVFDEKNVTLMDFRTAQTDGVNFIYVLPYSDREALIESTSFSQKPALRSAHLTAVAKYIAANFGDDYEIKSEESGELPMTAAKLPVRLNERIFNVGIAGGAARPSSGYAFQRIQRQTSQIARAIVSETEIPQIFAARKYNFFDALFLEAVARQPQSAQNCFMRMFEKVAPDALIRFLSDQSTLLDDLAVISALPKLAFGAAGLQVLWRNFAAENEKNEKLGQPHGIIFNSLDESARRLAARRLER